MLYNNMTPEDIQKQWFEVFKKTMEKNIFDMSKMKPDDMDDFMRLNMFKIMNPYDFGPQPNQLQEVFKDSAKTQMRFCIETMKVQIELLEKLLGDQDVK